MLTVATFTFLYYTVWVFLVQFINEDNPIHKYFLPTEYAIKLPIILLLLMAVFVTSFLSYVLIFKEEKTKKN